MEDGIDGGTHSWNREGRESHVLGKNIMTPLVFGLSKRGGSGRKPY